MNKWLVCLSAVALCSEAHAKNIALPHLSQGFSGSPEMTANEIAAIGEYHRLRSVRDFKRLQTSFYHGRAFENLLLTADARYARGMPICIADYHELRDRLGFEEVVAIGRHGFLVCDGYEEDRHGPGKFINRFAIPNFNNPTPGETEHEYAVRTGLAVMRSHGIFPKRVDAPGNAAWRKSEVDFARAAMPPPPKPDYREWRRSNGAKLGEAAFVKSTENGFTIVATREGEWIAHRTHSLSRADRDFIAADPLSVLSVAK